MVYMPRFSAAQNAFYLTVAAVFQKIVSFVYFTIVARALGVEDVGKYIFALTFTAIFSVFVDMGLSPALSREVARDNTQAERHIQTTLFIKCLLALVVYGIVVVTVTILDYDTTIRQLVYLSGITMIFDSFHLTFYAAFRGFQNLRYEAYAVFASQVTTLVLGSLFLWYRMPLIYLIAAFAIPAGLNMMYAGTLLKIKYGIRLFPKTVQKKSIITLLGVAWAFALAGIFSRLYSYFDTVLLSKLVGTQAVGIYSIPNKIAFAFQFIPLALSASIYPAMSAFFAVSREKVARIFEDSMVYLMLAALPIAGGLFVLGPTIIIQIYGIQYAASITPLKILMGSMVFAFLSFPVGSLLNACNRQKTQTTIMGLTVVLNVLLNIALIPRFGVSGAAIAALFGNCFLVIGGAVFLPRIAPIRILFLLRTLCLVLCATLIMMFVVYKAQLFVHWTFSVPIGVFVYVLVLFVMRVIHKDHIALFKMLIKKQSISEVETL